MITLYHLAKTRSTRFIFLLEELGVPYQLKHVTTRTRDGSGKIDPSNPHPHGKVPAIEHEGSLVFESPAIALYLTDTFPAAGLGPLAGDPKRGKYLSMLAYYTGVLEPAFMSKFMKTEVPVGTAGWVPLDEAMAFIIKTLTASPYMLGDSFSAVDVLYATTFAMFGASPMMPKDAALTSYVERCVARPAFARAQAKDAAP
jgi:glutathione S-transferase